MEIDLHAAGARIKQIRKKHKYSMATLATLVGTSSPSTVNNWEKGNNLPNKSRLEKIAILGNTTVEWIIYGTFEEYVTHLLTGVIAKEKLNSPIFMQQLLSILTNEHISYTDDLQLLTIAKNLYLMDEPEPIEASYFPQLSVEQALIFEKAPVYSIEKAPAYRDDLLPLLDQLLTVTPEESFLHQQLVQEFLTWLNKTPLEQKQIIQHHLAKILDNACSEKKS